MRIPAFLVLCFVVQLVYAQDSTMCEVYRFFGKDSAAQALIARQTLNSRNKIIYEYFEEPSISAEGSNASYCEMRYTYKDTLMVERVENNSGAVTKYVYEYDQQGRRFRESVFNLEFNSTQGVQELPSPRGGIACGFKGKWTQVSLATITYDVKGRKIQWDASRLHNTAETNIKWEYDDQNRVTSEKIAMRNGRIVHRTDYQYFDWGYRYWTINYDDEGNQRHELEAGQGYQPMIFHTVTFDKLGRIEKDVTSDEKSAQRGTTKYRYDAKGRIAREITEATGGQPDVTLIYKYSK